MSRITELEKQITELEERKVELQKELGLEKQKQFEYPFEYNKSYWLLDSKGEILHSCWYQDSVDTARCEIGNAFFTVKAAQKEKERRALLARFRQFRDKCNKDWKPHLKIVGLPKYCIAINNKTDVMFAMDVTFYNEFNPFGYFEKKEDCQRAIQLFGDEIKRLYVEVEK